MDFVVVSLVLLKLHVAVVGKVVFARFRHARAADARAWLAWYPLSGIAPLGSARMSLKEFNASAKVARKAPFDRKVEKPSVFVKVSAIAREQKF